MRPRTIATILTLAVAVAMVLVLTRSTPLPAAEHPDALVTQPATRPSDPAPTPAIATTRATTAPTTRPYTAHTFDDAIRELHDRGFPASMADLQSPAVPDDQNAAILLTKAARMIVPNDSGPRNSSLEYGPGLPYPQKWFELAEQSMVMHDELLKAVRKARSLPAVSWNPVMTGTPHDWMSANLAGFSDQRALTNIISDAALLEHLKGNDAEALEYARDMTFIAEASARRPFLVSHLVTVGLQSLDAHVLLLIGTELRIADARKPSGAVTGQEATRQQCQQLITCLLDDAALQDEYRRTFVEERVYALAEIKAQGVMAQVQFQEILPQYLEWFDRLGTGASTTGLEAATDHPLVKIAAASYAKLPQIQQQVGVQRAAAAIGIAARMYEEDHGAYPADLKSLVPDYLPHIPADPYSPTAASMLYRAGKRPMAGSVGPDGKDGQVPPPNRPKYSVERAKPGEPDDQWLDLTAWR